MAFRMDDRKQRIVVDGSTAARGLPSSAGKSRTRPRSTRWPRSSRPQGRRSRGAPAALADERHVKDLIVFSDPFGNRLEAFHGADVASDPFKPGRSISGFRTGPLGLGHVGAQRGDG